VITISQINKRISRYGYELNKGKGYFYFTPLNYKTHKEFYESGVYHNGLIKLNDLTLDEWVDEIKFKLETDENTIDGAETSIIENLRKIEAGI
jgi:hypothetical protein|tara:strand:+ start:470 stop:748 length:279 start_codon:yes stop_codon:yes gene_type:complete